MNQIQVFNKDKSLELNGINILARKEDGYVNATMMCKAGGKLFGHYRETKQNLEFLDELKRSIGIPIDLIHVQNKGVNDKRGTWVHRKVALHLAQWISPKFSVQVTNWLDELLITGKVVLGEEKTTEELETKYKERLEELTAHYEELEQEHKKLKKNHTNLLKKRTRDTYEKGSVLYIISHEAFTKEYKTSCFKFGMAKQILKENRSAFVNRLSTYNTGAPQNYKVHYLMYADNVKLLEDSIKERFNKNINPCNKEWIQGVCLLDLIEFVKTLCVLMKVEHNEVKINVDEKVEEVKEKIPFERYTFYELRKMCKDREIIQAGNKAQIIERLRKHGRVEEVKQIEEKKEVYADVYQYNNRGVFKGCFTNVSEASAETRIDEVLIRECIDEKLKKAGGFIWRNSRVEFTGKEIKKLNLKSSVGVLKMDSNNVIVKRYQSIKEAFEDTKLSRGIMDRLCRTGTLKDGFTYKKTIENDSLKMLRESDKQEIMKMFKNGIEKKVIAEKFKRTPKYIRILIKKLDTK